MELYFDNAATTPLLAEARETILQDLEIYGNPSSLHRLGVEAEKVLSAARRRLRKAADWENAQVVFTGCGTEADNLAIFGVCNLQQKPGHIVTTAVEHPAVLEPVKRLENLGWRVTYVRPDENGVIAAEDVLSAVEKDTVLVTVMHVNNETGDILPVREIAKGLREFPRVRFHVDGIQAFGKLPELAGRTGADLYSLSGHKIGAPKGIGALIIKPGIRLQPVLLGGGQEGGLRSGTENVPWVGALATAAELAAQELLISYEHVTRLNLKLREGLSRIPGCQVDDRPAERSPYIVNAAFPGLKGEVLVHSFEEAGLFVSTGSACSSKGGHATESHVLKAVGKSSEQVRSSLRFSMSRWQSLDDVDRAVTIVSKKTAWLREIMA